jgi:hypothetical protein
MILNKEINELASFFTETNDAFSLYFEPYAPADNSHRDEYVVAKERIQETIGGLHAVAPSSRTMVERAIETVAEMEGNHGLSKVIFACARRNFWREYDLPGKFGIRAEMGQTFAIAPLVTQQENQPCFGILLADRNRTRVLVLQAREIRELSRSSQDEQSKIRTTGTKKSVHLERVKEQPVLKHFRTLAHQLLRFHQQGRFEGLLVGCRRELWPEIESEFASDLRRILLGHFTVDAGLASLFEVREKAEKIIAQHDGEELNMLAQRAADAEASSGLGAIGLAQVCEALERDEVRTLLWPDPRSWFGKSAALCTRCGHLDLKMTAKCVLCGNEMRKFTRADEALVRKALSGGVEIRALRHTSLHPEEQISALLRFRAERNTLQALAS